MNSFKPDYLQMQIGPGRPVFTEMLIFISNFQVSCDFHFFRFLLYYLHSIIQPRLKCSLHERNLYALNLLPFQINKLSLTEMD